MSNRVRRAVKRWSRGRWWDWGHPAMALLGRGGDEHEVPRPRDLYVWRENGRLRWTTEYQTASTKPDVLVFDAQNDGFDLKIQWLSGGAAVASGRDMRLLLMRWLVSEWVRSEGLGLRRWAYYRALHCAVNDRKPFACQATPPPPGYSHWTCQMPRGHSSHGTPHRYRAYAWEDRGPVRYQQDAG